MDASLLPFKVWEPVVDSTHVLVSDITCLHTTVAMLCRSVWLISGQKSWTVPAQALRLDLLPSYCSHRSTAPQAPHRKIPLMVSQASAEFLKISGFLCKLGPLFLAVSVAAAKLTTEVERRKSTQADGAPCSRSRVFAPKISAADGQKDFGAEDEKAAEIPDRSYETTGQVVAPSCDLEQEVCWERSILTLSSSTAAFSSQEVSREQLPCSETLASLVEVVEEDGLSDAEYPVNHSEKAVVAGQTPPVLGAVSSTTVALDSSDDPANGAQGLQEVLFQNNWTRANSNFEHDGEELDHFLSVGLVSSLPGAPATTGRTPLPRPMTSGGASPVEGRLFPRIHGPGYKSALDDSRSSDSSDEPTASVVNPWSDLTLDTSFDAVVALKDEPLVLARTRLQSTPNNSDPAVGAVAATSNQEVASEEGNQPNDALTWIAQRHMNSGSSAVNSGIDEEFVDCDDLQVGCNIWPNSPGSGPAYLHPVQTETNPGFSPAGSMYFDCETPLGTPVHLNPVPKVPEAFSGAGHELDQARLGRPFPLVSAVEAEHVVASCAALFCLAFKYQIALGSISENTVLSGAPSQMQ